MPQTKVQWVKNTVLSLSYKEGMDHSLTGGKFPEVSSLGSMVLPTRLDQTN